MKPSSPLPLLVLLLAVLAASPARAGGPAISITASPTVITDQGDDAFFTITASSPVTRSTAIQFVLTGTALPNQSYTLVGNFNHGRIVLSPGQSSTVVQLHTYDVDGPPFLTAGIVIVGGTKYHIGSPRSASVTIQNVR